MLAGLVGRADVLIENFRPGVLDRLGFSVARLHEINPGLVILSITGFGHDGPEGSRPGYDQIAQGEGGIMSSPGPRRTSRCGLACRSPTLAGMYGAYGVVAALTERSRPGSARSSGPACWPRSSGRSVPWHPVHGRGEVPRPTGNYHPSICPYGLYRAADGFLQIAVGSDALWQRLAPAFGLDRPQWALNRDRVRDHAR